MPFIPFTADDRMAVVIDRYRPLILVLPRLHVSLGFGDQSVAEVCRACGVETRLLLDICNMYAFEQYTPHTDNLTIPYFNGLLAYLTESHRYYRDERIPHIGAHLSRIADACPPAQGKLLLRFFDEYRKDMCNHFTREEQTVFPYVRELLESHRRPKYAIGKFAKTHTNIEDKPDDLTNIILKYIPGDVMPHDRISILFDLFSLSTDLCSHARIEEKILVPAVERLEQQQL